MALDPTISLRAGQNVPKFDMGAAAESGLRLGQLAMQPQLLQQQLSGAQAAEAATRLGMKQTEQQIAQSTLATQQQQRIEAARKRANELAKQFSTVDPRTGKITIDHRQLSNTLMFEGHELDTALAHAQKADVVESSQLKTDTDRANYARDAAAAVNELIRVQTDPARARQILDSRMAAVAQVAGPEAASTAFGGVFGEAAANPDADVVGQAKINAAAQISPAQAEQFKISKEQLSQGWSNIGIAQQQLIQAGASNLTSPDALNPKSAVSQAYRDLALKAGVPASQVENLSASQIHRIPGISDQVTANIVPAGTRSEAAMGSVRSQVEADFFDKLGSVARQLSASKYSELTPANIIANKFNQALLSDPAANQYITMIREGQAKGYAISENQGPGSITRFAEGEAQLKRKQAQTQGKIAATPTFTETQKPAAGAAEGGLVIGQVYGTGADRRVYVGGPRTAETSWKKVGK